MRGALGNGTPLFNDRKYRRVYPQITQMAQIIRIGDRILFLFLTSA
jgi:hypothetical protein